MEVDEEVEVLRGREEDNAKDPHAASTSATEGTMFCRLTDLPVSEEGY